jgi:serpin B
MRSTRVGSFLISIGILFAPGCGSSDGPAASGLGSGGTPPPTSLLGTGGTGEDVAPPSGTPDALPAVDAGVAISTAVDANPTPTVGFATSSLQREMNPQVPADLTTLASGNAAFAFDMYGKLKNPSSNVVFSPVSISLALAMTFAGAATTTATEMVQSLHFTLPPDRLHRAFNALDQALASRGQGLSGTNGGAMRLDIANSAWLERTYSLLPTYLDVLALNYGTGINLVDFLNAPETSRGKINAWVSDKTQGKIPELLSQGMVDNNTKLVLTNAVYFNAAWKNPFNALFDHDNNFTLLDGNITTRRYMYASLSGIKAKQGTNYVAAALPYQDDRLSLVVVVPDAGKFADVESALDAKSFGELLTGLTSQKVSLYLPPFRIDTRASLPDTLKKLGMLSAFCPADADFSGMDGSRNLCIKDVMHLAFIAVAEEGTEAGAATAVVMEDSSIAFDAGYEPPPLLVKAERPFLYYLYDQPTGAILFMGSVLDPLQK